MTIMEKVTSEEYSNSRISRESDNEASQSANNSEEENDLTNTGWADAISKILKQKPKSKRKSIVLSKAKKLSDVKKKVKPESPGFEIEGAAGSDQVKQEISEDIKTEILEPIKKKRKELPNVRVKPNILEKSRERVLQKIATKGVVQLFNAVKGQQNDITKKIEEAGPLEIRKEKVLKNIDKRAFLDVLMGEKSERVDTNLINTTEKKEKSIKNEDKDVTWSVLKEDFMMGAKMKDWDKELETEEVELESN